MAWQLRTLVLLERDDDTGRLRLSVRGSKLLLLVTVVILGLLIFGIVVTGYRPIFSYGAYEGRVLKIEDDWVAGWFESDISTNSRLTIETPKGDTIVRVVDDRVIAFNRIEVGDTIRKERGFANHPRPLGKKTYSELMDELERKMKGASGSAGPR